MCRFLLWMIPLLNFINHSEGGESRGATYRIWVNPVYTQPPYFVGDRFKPPPRKVYKPEVERKVFKPKVVKPKVVKPKVIKPKVVKPKVTVRPKVIRPKVLKPKEVPSKQFKSKVNHYVRRNQNRIKHKVSKVPKYNVWDSRPRIWSYGGSHVVRAKHGIVKTKNFETASLQWEFNFQPSTPISMFIEMVDEKDAERVKSRIAYYRNGQFQAFDHIKERVRISIPPNRNGVIIDISNIVISDSGSYRFKAVFVSGDDAVNITRLVVIVPPRISAIQNKLNRYEGQNASLLCNLEAGNPKPLTFQWFRHNVPLTPVKSRDYNLTYYIPNVGHDDVGKYRCDVGGLGGVDSHTVDLFVTYKPVVTSPPLNRSVFENFGTEQLKCLCEGNAGRTRYHWFKRDPYPPEIKSGEGGITISADGTTLTFVKPSRTLATMYYCAGSNDLGLGRPKGAFLNVTYKPGPIEIITNAGDGKTINGKEGQNMTINCKSDANPPAHYNWYKIVKSFWGSNEREFLVKYSLSGDLNLLHVDRNDTAEYTCEAVNRPNVKDRSRLYKVTREVFINIRFGPRQTNFTVNEQNHTYIEVKEYSKVTIRCVSHSEPGADYNIRKEGDQTQLNENSKIGVVVIERILTSQEGTYVCVASNALTQKYEKKKIRVVVAVPPTRVDPLPDSKTLEEGATVSINCIAKGKPAPHVFWQRYGANITHNDSVIQTYYSVRPVKDGILSIVDASLKFTGIRYTDDASYSCVFNNSAANLNITNIRYIVQFSPKITTRPENLTREVGKEAKFTCAAFGNPTDVQWRWYFNDVEIPGEISSTYIIGYANPDDNGYYKCVPWNTIGDGQSGIARLEVRYEPTITVSPKENYTKEVYESLSMACEAIGVPTPRIFWRKTSSPSFMREGRNLVFESLKPKDSGQYSCNAKNIMGAKSASTYVFIKHRPIIMTNKPYDTKVGSKDGVEVSLTCIVNSYPLGRVGWRDKLKDTVITNGADYKIIEENLDKVTTSSTLKFVVHSHQLGKKYICVAKNDYGDANQEFQVLVEGKPDPPESGSLKAVDYLIPTVPVTVNINFTWIAGYNGGAEVDFYLWFKEKRESRFHEQHMTNREGFKYVFQNRKAGATYVFSMTAKNNFGVSQWYQPYLEFSTKAPPPNAANVTFQRVGDDGTTVRVFWEIRPQPKQNRERRDVENKWEYGVIRYRFADMDIKWNEEHIRKIAVKGSYLVENLEPERLYEFHFILYDKYNNFANPILIGRFFPRAGPALASQTQLTKTDIIAIGVACGGAILIVSIIILIIAICKKKQKPSYGKASYGNGRTRVDIPVSTAIKAPGYNHDEAPRYFKAEEEDLDIDDDDPLAQDSGSGLDAGDKSPPPDYNAVHYPVPPREHNQSSFSDDIAPSYTTFGRLTKHPNYSSKDGVNPARSMQSLSGSRATEIVRGPNRYSFDVLDDYPTYRAGPNIGLGQPLLRKSINDLDEDYRKPPDASQGHRGSRGRMSSDEDLAEPPRVPPPDDAENRVPGAFGDRAQRFKKPPYKPYDDENGSLSPPNGRQSPNGSSIASSKPYRSDNEYIEEADENYVGYLV